MRPRIGYYDGRTDQGQDVAKKSRRVFAMRYTVWKDGVMLSSSSSKEASERHAAACGGVVREKAGGVKNDQD